MNTEFPTRVPTLKNSTNASVQNNSEVINNSTNVIKDAIQVLKNLTDKVSNFINTKIFGNKSNVESKKDNNKSVNTPIVNIAHESVNTLKRLTQMVGDFFNRTETRNVSQNRRQNIIPTKDSNSGFFKAVGRNFSALFNLIEKSVSSIQDTFRSTNAALGSSIGRVFGQGIFGNMISKVITSALDHLPTIALIGGIIYGLYWVSGEISKAIKWLGASISQAIDGLIDILPFGKSKYQQAREDMAKSIGVSSKDVLSYYGDTVTGRQKAYDDWKRMQEDPEYAAQMKAKIAAAANFQPIDLSTKKNPKNLIGLAEYMTSDWKAAEDEAYKKINHELNVKKARADETANYIRSLSTTSGDVYGMSKLSDMEGGSTSVNNTPIVNNVVNSTTHNTPIFTSFGSNVNTAAPIEPLSSAYSDGWYIGMRMPGQ